MPNQIDSSSSLWKQTQNDIFSDGKNDQSSANAGAIVTASLAEGQATTTAGVDGDLRQIDTGAEALALDPTENTSGNAAKAFSSTFLLRWAVKILQGISGKLPALVSGKIPVDAGGATAAEIGTAVNSALKGSSQPISASSLPLPTGAATESTLNSVLTQLQGDRAISENLFIDSTNTIYLRVLAYNQQTNAFESSAIGLNGTAYTPTAPETPLQRSDYDTTETVWEIVANGTGYAVGDIVSQFTLITQGPPIAVAGVLWFNQTSQLGISAPLSGHRRRIGALAATESTLDALNDKIAPLGQAIMAQSNPVVIASNQSAVPIALPGLQANTPIYNTPGLPVREIGASLHDCSFHLVGAGLLAPEMVQIASGSAHTISQAGGALVISSGTTANSEFLARSVDTVLGAFQFSASVVASQRIANNNFAIIIGDLIGENLDYTINSATSITVTLPGHLFTAQNIGQFMMVGGLSVSGSVPGRYAIASVVANTSITFTVSGFPASGTGTCSLFGHSHYKILHTGTSSTGVNLATQRKGWGAADVGASINTTAGVGTIEYLNAEITMAYFADRLRATAPSTAATSRASFSENIPPIETPLHVFLWSYNGSTAPASSTNWTISFWQIEDIAKTPVTIGGINQIGTQNPFPVSILGTASISGTVTNSASNNLIGDLGGGVRSTSGGLALPNRLISSAAGTNGTIIKATAGRLYKIKGYNNSASLRFLKLHNNATVAPGTTPIVGTYALKPNDYFDLDFGLFGQFHSTGICYSITENVADNDTTAIAAGDIVGLNVWFA
jgi:hypothetical protein